MVGTGVMAKTQKQRYLVFRDLLIAKKVDLLEIRRAWVSIGLTARQKPERAAAKYLSVS